MQHVILYTLLSGMNAKDKQQLSGLMVTGYTTYQDIKFIIREMHTQFTPLYFTGNILCPIDFPKASGQNWVPTSPSSPSELLVK